VTYRERREAKADRLRGWAEKRQKDAAAVLKAGEPFTGDIAFNTQPGHIPFRAHLIAREDRAYESLQKARSMTARAASIEAQADHAIYSDDPDAIARLTEKIAALEAKREHIKTTNAAFRKTHKVELAAEQNSYLRDCMMPFRAYEGQNLSGNLTRLRARLASLQRQTPETDK